MKKTIFEREGSDFRIAQDQKTGINTLLVALESCFGDVVADVDLFEITGKSEWLIVYKNGVKVVENSNSITVFTNLKHTAFWSVLAKTIQIYNAVDDEASQLVHQNDLPISQRQAIITALVRSLNRSVEPKHVKIRHPAAR